MMIDRVMVMQKKITYRHWKKDKVLEVTGTLPHSLISESSDRYVVQTTNGLYEDVIKSTVISIEDIDNNKT